MRHAVDGAAMLEQQLEHRLAISPVKPVDRALAAVRAFREGLMH